MSEIEKLMQNAEIEPERQDCCKIADKYWASNTESGFEYLMQKECPYNQECTDECEYAYDKVVYPPFTAEKLLELIVFLVNRKQPLIFSLDEGKGKISKTFIEIGITKIINNLWQDLTEEEKQQVKGVLE